VAAESGQEQWDQLRRIYWELIRWKRDLDLLQVRVFGPILLEFPVDASELIPLFLATFSRNRLRQSPGRGIALSFLYIGNLPSFKIHLQAHGDGGRRSRRGRLKKALEGNVLAPASGILANDGFIRIPATSELALLYEEFTLVTWRCR